MEGVEPMSLTNQMTSSRSKLVGSSTLTAMAMTVSIENFQFCESVDCWKEFSPAPPPPSLSLSLSPPPFLPPSDVGQCEVEYGYTAQQGDELTISPGDVVNIIEKYDEDWWQGELNGQVGIFPASYVKDV